MDGATASTTFKPAPTSRPANGGPRKLDALTGARFVAALYVVLYHSARTMLLPVPLLGSMIQSAAACMSFFFILSGFVLGYGNHERALDRRDFYINRLCRIYPVYLIALLLALPRFILDISGSHHFGTGLGALISAPLLLHSWLPNTATAWNAPGWSVSVEAFFYAVFPFCLYWFPAKRLSGLFVSLAALWALVLLPPFLYWQINPNNLNDMSVAAHESFSKLEAGGWLGVVLHNPLFHLPEFVAGIVLSRIFHRTRDVAQRFSNWAFWPAAIAMVAACAGGLGVAYPIFHNGLLLPVFLVLIYCLAVPPRAIEALLGSRAMVILGDASYPIYILQHPVSTLFKAAWYVVTGVLLAGTYTSWLALLFYTTLLCAISVGLSVWVDPPLRRHAKTYVSRFFRPQFTTEHSQRRADPLLDLRSIPSAKSRRMHAS